jgi:hypothetical protein
VSTLAGSVRRTFESRSCRRVAKVLPDLVERATVADLGVHRHLRSCAACQAKLRQYRSLHHLMGDLPVELPTAVEPNGSALSRSEAGAAVGGAMLAVAAVMVTRVVRRRA